MTTYLIKVKLNDTDPVDAAILESLRGCIKGRMSARVRELLAVALGINPGKLAPIRVIDQPAPAQAQLESPTNITPFKVPDEKAALTTATNNFLNAFG